MKAIQDRRNLLFVILTGIFLTNALLAELVGTKIFSLENTLGFQPAQLPLFAGYVLDFNLTAGVVLWPVVFITTDIINEYFGKKGVKRISFMTIGFIIYAFIILFLVTRLKPAAFWLDINSTTASGKPFNIDYAFNKVFLQATSIIIGSLSAFLIGQLLDVFVFHKLRKLTGHRFLWLRATGSTLVSQLVDSFVVLFVAFYFLAPERSRWPVSQVVSVGIINYIYKFIIAVVLTPLLYLAHGVIDRFLGKEAAESLIDKAAEESEGFL